MMEENVSSKLIGMDSQSQELLVRKKINLQALSDLLIHHQACLSTPKQGRHQTDWLKGDFSPFHLHSLQILLLEIPSIILPVTPSINKRHLWCWSAGRQLDAVVRGEQEHHDDCENSVWDDGAPDLGERGVSGRHLGASLAVVQVYTVGKELFQEKPEFLVTIPVLGMIDNTLGITEAGVNAQQMNAYINTTTADKGCCSVLINVNICLSRRICEFSVHWIVS